MGMISDEMNLKDDALTAARYEYQKLFDHIAKSTGIDLRKLKFVTTSEQIATPALLVFPDLNQKFEVPADLDNAVALIITRRGSKPGTYYTHDREFKHLWIRADKDTAKFSARIVDAPLNMKQEWKTDLDGKGLLAEIDAFIEKFARNELKGAIKRALPQAKVPVEAPAGAKGMAPA